MTVEDATLALKGILGIASNKPTTKEIDQAKKSRTPSMNKKKKKSKTPTTESTPNLKESKKEANKVKEGGSSMKKSRAKNKKEDQKAEGENYAWSSFQSPPDASSLPLPAFGSFDDVFIRDKKEESSFMKSTNEDSTTEQDSHGINISELVISDTSETKEECKDSSITSKKSQNQTSDIEESKIPQDPLAMLLNPTYGASVSNPGTLSPYSGPHHSIQQPYITTPIAYNQSLHHGSLPPQPPFFSIQVQVPPNLLPGRRMMVQAPPGQPPISVVVPEGIQPGMFMPVTVPAYPYHLDPRLPHPQGMYPGPYPMSPVMYMNQGYDQHPPTSPTSSHREQKKTILVPPSSWAAKVAAPPKK